MAEDKSMEMFGIAPNPPGTGHGATDAAQAEAAVHAPVATYAADWNDAGGSPLPVAETTLPAIAPVISAVNAPWTAAELLARFRG